MKKEKEEVMVKARMTIKTGFSLILLLFASTFCVCMSMSLICKYPAFCYNSMAIQTLSSLSLLPKFSSVLIFLPKVLKCFSFTQSRPCVL